MHGAEHILALQVQFQLWMVASWNTSYLLPWDVEPFRTNIWLVTCHQGWDEKTYQAFPPDCKVGDARSTNWTKQQGAKRWIGKLISRNTIVQKPGLGYLFGCAISNCCNIKVNMKLAIKSDECYCLNGLVGRQKAQHYRLELVMGINLTGNICGWNVWHCKTPWECGEFGDEWPLFMMLPLPLLLLLLSLNAESPAGFCCSIILISASAWAWNAAAAGPTIRRSGESELSSLSATQQFQVRRVVSWT